MWIRLYESEYFFWTCTFWATEVHSLTTYWKWNTRSCHVVCVVDESQPTQLSFPHSYYQGMLIFNRIFQQVLIVSLCCLRSGKFISGLSYRIRDTALVCHEYDGPYTAKQQSSTCCRDKLCSKSLVLSFWTFSAKIITFHIFNFFFMYFREKKRQRPFLE